jgi:hypothetical protein
MIEREIKELSVMLSTLRTNVRRAISSNDPAGAKDYAIAYGVMLDKLLALTKLEIEDV